jgi:hypothetical protein
MVLSKEGGSGVICKTAMHTSTPSGKRKGGFITENFAPPDLMITRIQVKKRLKEPASISARDQGSTAPNMKGAKKSKQKSP